MKITIIGNGAWGQAVCFLLRENNFSVLFWNRKDITIDADIIILAVPTQAIRTIFEKIKFSKKEFIIVNTSKGIERKTHKLPFQIVSEFLGSNIDYFSLMGPSFAEEVKSSMPTLVNLGYIKKGSLNKLMKLFETDFFRIRPVKGVEIIELAAALKNVYAIITGLSDGLGFGVNTRTKLILIAIDEFYKLNSKLRNRLNLKMSPGTIGDLVLTCSSTKSRNFTFGKLLATNKIEEALSMCKTVEGYHTVSSMSYFANRNKIKLPLAKLIEDIIESDNPNLAREKFLDFIKKV